MTVYPSGPNLAMYVLDAMTDDIEDLTSIMRYLSEWRAWWPHDFTEDEVPATLASLVDDGLVEVYDAATHSHDLHPVERPVTDHESLRRYWFLPTPKGRLIWEKWDAPSLPD